MDVRSLSQHAHIRPGTEHPRLRRRDDHRRHLWVLETQTLHGIVEFNIDTEIIGIELQLIARHQWRVFLDVHSQRGDPPLDAQFPVLVALWMRGEIDVEFLLGHQVTSWRMRIGISNAILPQSRRECTLRVGEATGRLLNPASGGRPGALPAASRPQDGERYRAYWGGVTGSRPQPAALVH